MDKTSLCVKWVLVSLVSSGAYIVCMMLIVPVHYAVLRFCPNNYQDSLSTTDFNLPGSTLTIQSCNAPWYVAVDVLGVVIVCIIAILAASFLVWRTAPFKPLAASLIAALLFTFLSVLGLSGLLPVD